MRLAGSNSPARGCAGFTLVEVLLGLALLSAAALFAVPMTRTSIAAQALQTAANDLAAAARMTRAAAIKAGTERSLFIDVEGSSYWATGTERKRKLPARIAMQIEMPASETIAGPVQRIRFAAGGGSSGGRIVLRDGGRIAIVAIDWLTGGSHVER